MTPFWNRTDELAQIRRRLGRGLFGYVTGRRRVGKTALLGEAARRFGGLYHQAVEGTPQQQLLHFSEEVRETLPIFRDVVPTTWSECLRLLARERLPKLLIFDEFPYWVQGDPTLPSLLQKWIDHDLPRYRTLVLVSGSSQSMLYSQFLSQAAPLYGRASFRLDLPPLSYRWFCKVLGYPVRDPASFVRFSLVGGVPHYWRLMPRGPLLRQADALYFQPMAILAEEPTHLLREEGITGSLPKAILDLVGRGVSKPSELAARLGTGQTNLSRPLALLLELGLLHRELPFGESPRTTKKVLYNLQDPALAFYYGACLTARSGWPRLSPRDRQTLLYRHAARVWEQFCRRQHPGAGRYWEGDVELDLVAPLGGRRFLVAECKWGAVSPSQARRLIEDLKVRFHRTRLARTLPKVSFRLLIPKDLPELANSAFQK
ncbi:MAG: AAA family ATPase [Candidatus Omnitrophica bacterium]|nr:AAA family ATPase [Candidatus Omnitrophota bacterium]